MQADAGPIVPARAGDRIVDVPRPRQGTPSAARFPPVLLASLAVLSLAVLVYALVPMSDVQYQVLYQVIATAALVVGFAGLRRHRPVRRRGWFLILLGYSVWVLGDLGWTAEQYLIPERYPAPSDALYLSAYVVLGAGALIFVRTRRGGRDLTALLDAAILTTGAGVLIVVFLVAPLTQDSSLSVAGKVVSAAYPLGDLFLLGVIARMHATPGARTMSYRLLTASLIMTLLADLVWNVAVGVSGSPVATAWVEAVFLAGYLLIAAAAGTPSMKTLSEPAPDRVEAAPTKRRLTALTCGLLLPGVALLLDGLNGGGILWPVIGVGSLILSALVLMRMIGLLNVVQVQAVRLTALARSDALTGAPNRRTWDLELARACVACQESGTTLSVAILDLDRFKAYNDSRGHQAGDRLLREAVAAWTEALPPGALLARYGGEEFAVLFPGLSARAAAVAIERMRSLTPDDQTFSAGVATWDPDGDPTTAIADADEALYVAKRTGRDRVVMHDTKSSMQPGGRAMPLFTMVTQPIVDIATSRVIGHEALARFSGAERSIAVDDVFRQGHVDGHGDMLELAAVQAALALQGRPDGQDLYVNVSARALTSERFLAGLPTRLGGIVFELNEQTDEVALSAVADVVTRLRARGARIALDDVGAGAQEFARLATLRPDVVKIDRSLVTGCADDAARTAVIRALIGYAGELGLTICAEGVEEIAELRHLDGLGITYAQGYLLARPGTIWYERIDTAAIQAA